MRKRMRRAAGAGGGAMSIGEDPFLLKHLPGESEPMRLLRRRIQVLNTPANIRLIRNVLIVGPSGSGKNHTASIIAAHRRWLVERQQSIDEEALAMPPRALLGGFAEVSLPGVPDALVESELFGHKRGAFTDAHRDRSGYFGEGKSDILLDEVGDSSMPMQAKLLRVLNSGQYRPLGGEPGDESETDSRILMATNRNLSRLVKQGKFREDLLWRIREFVLEVPPLSRQGASVRLLADSILSGFGEGRAETLGSRPALTEADLLFAEGHGWPGNVRELRHVLKRWLADEGRQPLSRIAGDLEAEMARDDGEDPYGDLVRESVITRLKGAAREGKPLAGTVGEFVEQYTAEAKDAVSSWLGAGGARSEDALRVFPLHSNPDALRAIVRKWGKRAR